MQKIARTDELIRGSDAADSLIRTAADWIESPAARLPARNLPYNPRHTFIFREDPVTSGRLSRNPFSTKNYRDVCLWHKAVAVR